MCHILETLKYVWHTWAYACQLFLRYKREIVILGVLGFLKTTRSFPKIPEEVRSLPRKSEVFWRRPKSSKDVRSLPKAKFSLAFHFKNQRSRRRYCHLFILHMVFVPYMVLSWHIFGNCVKQNGNNSHFSIRCEKLVRRRELAWDQSFQPAGVRVGRYTSVTKELNSGLLKTKPAGGSRVDWTWGLNMLVTNPAL